MTKENLVQVIVGMFLTILFSVTLSMDWASFIPAVIAGIIWGGIKQTSGKKYPNKDGELEAPKFWKDFVPVIAGCLVVYFLVVII